MSRSGAREAKFGYMPVSIEEGFVLNDEDAEASDEDMERNGSEELAEEPKARGAVAAALGALGALGGVALLAVAIMPHLTESQRSDADVDKSVEEFGGFETVAVVAKGIGAASKVMNDAQEMYPDLQKMAEPTYALRHEAMQSGAHPLYNLTEYANLTGEANKPGDNRNDGNLCPDDEEESAGLCYRRCSDITGGKFPIRTGAFSCCESYPCTFFNSVFSNPLNFCDGYDVAGVHEQSGCPHTPGDCLKNEEFNLGQCYKKCAILTENAYPYRVSADSCCRYNSHLACLDALNIYTNVSLSVGGGAGDGDPATSNDAHQPMLRLTEKKEHYT